MPTLQRYIPPSSSHLLAHILDRPDLLAAVRELTPSSLSSLINRVGLEDAGEIVALATTEQLEQVFDHDLWKSDGPGREERFDPQRFALWLAVMSEAGEQFLVDRLCALPVDLLILAVHRLILIIDTDVLSVEMSDASDDSDLVDKALDSCLCEEWEEFRLISRDAAAWDDVLSALLSLDRDHHDLLRDIIERCCFMSTEFIADNGGLYEVLTTDESLENDALAERDDRRAAEGFISAADARSFLLLASDPTQPRDVRDPITHAYFRELVRKQPKAALTSAPVLTSGRPTADVAALLQLLADTDPDAHKLQPKALPSAPSPKKKPASRKRSSAPPPPSAADADIDAEQPQLLERALTELASQNPAVHAERMDELGYLANVLVSGCPHAGRKFRPIEALEAAVATCNLGFERQLAVGAAHSERGLSLEASTLARTAADLLFRHGWSALQLELGREARHLLHLRVQASGSQQQQRLALELLQKGDVFALEGEIRPDQLGLSQDAWQALLALAGPLPFLSDKPRTPFIASERDLRAARDLLAKLAHG